MRTLLLSLLLTFTTIAFATPESTVETTVQRLLQIVSSGNHNQQISQMCTLAKGTLDNSTIGSDILGTFARLERDADGISRFKSMIPSIVVEQFHESVAGKGSLPYKIEGRVAKGSNRTGVRVKIGTRDTFVITVLNATEKVVDVEWNNLSLVRSRAGAFQSELRAYYDVNPQSSLPVSELVKKLVRQGVTKCN